ncbi:hypothetical protein [Lactiplantibacillus modestisalitolerans]|uniref:Uncharacterized protein n=1 Tax=Lactiplantibacillus modestisalitolerans TaxID=1457219 RepID=A0ABV5WQQ2_9LACO|nr:hypothetical protein [Lactiplantibacillus modestisalitolerans]
MKKIRLTAPASRKSWRFWRSSSAPVTITVAHAATQLYQVNRLVPLRAQPTLINRGQRLHQISFTADHAALVRAQSQPLAATTTCVATMRLTLINGHQTVQYTQLTTPRGQLVGWQRG